MEPEIRFELLKNVHEDLEFLAKEWNKDIDDGSIRRSVSCLYQLLVDNQLSLAALVFTQEIKILVSIYEEQFAKEDLTSITFYAALGVTHKGIYMEHMSEHPYAPTQEEVSQKYDLAQDRRRTPYKISKYLNLPAFIYKETHISRLDVLKYARNKIGAAHYDPTRAENKIMEKKFTLLDEIRSTYTALDKDIIYLEILSIGQRIINAPDTHKLRKKISKILDTFKVSS